MDLKKVKTAADRAAHKGPHPTQPIVNAQLPGVRPVRFIGDFGGRRTDNYPGNARFEKIQQSSQDSPEMLKPEKK